MPPHTGRYGLPEASWVPLAARVLCSANTPAPAYPGSARGACGGASVAAGLVQAQGHRRQHQLICQDATVWRSCLSTKPLSQFSRIRAPGSAYRARAQVMAQGGVPSSTGSTTAPIYAPPPCHRPPAHSSKRLREASWVPLPPVPLCMHQPCCGTCSPTGVPRAAGIRGGGGVDRTQDARGEHADMPIMASRGRRVTRRQANGQQAPQTQLPERPETLLYSVHICCIVVQYLLNSARKTGVCSAYRLDCP